MDRQRVTADQLEALAQCADLYSVRLAFCQDQNNSADHIPASGVLVKLGMRYFILTAGHVARCAQSHGDPYVSVAKRWHSFRPKVAGLDFRFEDNQDTSEDAGYIEYSSHDATVIESQNKVFASYSRISSVGPKNLRCEGTPLFLFGFPADYVQEFKKPVVIASRILDKERPSELPQADDNYYLDLAIDRTKMELFDGTQLNRQPPGNLGGASGSGLWAILSEDLNPDSIQLIGIATFHSQENWTEGNVNLGFVRATRICRILSLIRDAYPQAVPDIDKACCDDSDKGDT